MDKVIQFPMKATATIVSIAPAAAPSMPLPPTLDQRVATLEGYCEQLSRQNLELAQMNAAVCNRLAWALSFITQFVEKNPELCESIEPMTQTFGASVQ